MNPDGVMRTESIYTSPHFSNVSRHSRLYSGPYRDEAPCRVAALIVAEI
jgi:hypothetical protein